jgi:hypothetical protein
MHVHLCPGCVLLPVAPSTKTVEGASVVGVSTESCGLGSGQSYSVILGLPQAVLLGQTIIAFGLHNQVRKHKL